MTDVRPLDITNIRIAPLADTNALKDFECGERELDRSIEKCCEWHRRYRSRVVCAFIGDDPLAYGFYCLGISATDAKKLDEAIVRDNDGRNFVPFIYIYALAVREQFQTQKIGTLLLMHALDRCARFVLDVGAYGVALHAVNERVTKLYERYGFRQMNDLKRPFMILPAQSLVDLFGNNMAAR